MNAPIDIDSAVAMDSRAARFLAISAAWRAFCLPTFLEPSLGSPCTKPPSGPKWIQEINHDGYRMQARIDGRTPHQEKRFKVSNDPDFGKKVEDIVGLYLDPRIRRACCPSTRRARFRRLTGRAHDAPMTIPGLEIGMFGQKLGDLGFDRVGQQGARPLRKISVKWSVKIPG